MAVFNIEKEQIHRLETLALEKSHIIQVCKRSFSFSSEQILLLSPRAREYFQKNF
jgi:hypothetical protein